METQKGEACELSQDEIGVWKRAIEDPKLIGLIYRVQDKKWFVDVRSRYEPNVVRTLPYIKPSFDSQLEIPDGVCRYLGLACDQLESE